MEIQLYSSNTVQTPPIDSSSSSHSDPNSMQSWWESISKARSRIHALSSLFPPSSSLISLADSDLPAKSLLESPEASLAISSALSLPSSGSSDDPLCQWLYETFQTSDPDLHTVVLSYIPLVSGLYLSRVVDSHVSDHTQVGFEALFLAIYAAETRTRGGKPLMVHVPDLSQPSLYHSPRQNHRSVSTDSRCSIGVLSGPLEPMMGVKSTKRVCIVGVAFDWFYRKISVMPKRSKIDLCEFVVGWSGQNCPCRFEFDSENGLASVGDGGGGDGGGGGSVSVEFHENGSMEGEISSVSEEMDRKLRIGNGVSSNGCCGEIDFGVVKGKGSRIPLPWELLQPVLRILGHCLLAPLNPQEVRDAASAAVRCLYARASHDLVPQAILAARSLIQLDKRARLAAKAEASANAAMKVSTPTKPQKPEILLVSK